MPKLFTASVACPHCKYPNDENFRFCQQCGYARKESAGDPGNGQEILAEKINEEAISERIVELAHQRGATKYARQKTSLEKEFAAFLASRSCPKPLISAQPDDVIAFLVWKDRAGKTKVHSTYCRSQRGASNACDCPKRLAFATVDSMIGKLRSIFLDHGRGSDWITALNMGNPAACRVVRRYLSDVREEQLKARVTPQQAEPVLIADVEVISRHILSKLQDTRLLTQGQIFVLARDQAFLKCLFFAGDRAADLLSTVTQDILSFPDNSGLLLNHCLTKSLRSGDGNVFALKRGSNKGVCPVWGLECYFKICRLLRIKLAPGYVFPSVSKSGTISSAPMESAAAQARLNQYVTETRPRLSGTRFNLHGFRSGAAVSMALAEVELHDIMDHVGWRTSKTALHYIKLKQVLNPAGPAAKLADLDPSTGKKYQEQNTLKGFLPAFTD